MVDHNTAVTMVNGRIAVVENFALINDQYWATGYNHLQQPVAMAIHIKNGKAKTFTDPEVVTGITESIKKPQ